MPCYEFECQKCKHKFDELLHKYDYSKVRCPKCKSKKLKKLLSKPNFRIQWSRGRGYYKSS